MLSSVALAASFLFAGTTKAEVFDIQDGEFAGSFITSFFKFQPTDKTLSTTATGEVKKRFGEFQSHTVTDFNLGGEGCSDFNEDPLTELLAFYVKKSNVVLTFKKGQLFLKAVPGDQFTSAGMGCFTFNIDPEIGDLAEIPGSFQLTVEYKVVGGTGEYTGAKGELTSTSSGTVLEYNSSTGEGDNWFGGVTGTLEGSFCTDCP
ncbi:hypothetical protein [Microbulbifer mangrovi]|uniref:hypothetical protein n=1 Tax=Microbulbifer mangrovi TaxID=927787 RepID=UPI00099069B4|nr:hypothetical protein [Microbulbifer mangrovi]